MQESCFIAELKLPIDRIPAGVFMVHVFEIIIEHEEAGGWLYEFQTVNEESGELCKHQMHLSWVDYNHWSATGSDNPQKVAEAVLGFLLSRLTIDELSDRFDASFARRRFGDADETIPKMIGS